MQAALERRTDHGGPTQTLAGQLAGRKKDSRSFILAVDRIRPDQDQVRRLTKSIDAPDLKQLAASIREYGLRNPPEVRWIEADDTYELVSGERRFLAITKILEWTELPVRIVDASEEQILWLQLHENIHRQDLHPLDLAAAVQKVIDAGATIDHVAERLCKSKTFVQKALTISKSLSDEARSGLQSVPQLRSLEIIYDVAQLPPKEQPRMIQKIAEEKLSRDAVRAITRKTKSQRHTERQPRGGRPTTAKPYHWSITTKNGASVTVRFRKHRVTMQEVIAALREVLKTLEV